MPLKRSKDSKPKPTKRKAKPSAGKQAASAAAADAAEEQAGGASAVDAGRSGAASGITGSSGNGNDAFENVPVVGKHARKPALEGDAASRVPQGGGRMFPRPDEPTLESVSAMGDSIVDALTSDFGIPEVPAPAQASSTAPIQAVPDAAGRAGRGAAPRTGAQGAQAEARWADRGSGVPEPGFADAVSGEDLSAETTASFGPIGEDAAQGDGQPDSPAAAPDGKGSRSQRKERKRRAKAARAAKPKRPRRHISGKKVAIAIVVLLLAAAVAFAAFFVWDRWYRYDDAQDVQGEWQLANTQRIMVITGSDLEITTDVSYEYTIDAKAKTITYSFGDKQGTASYRFSEDRNTLVIEENADTDWLVALHLKSDDVMDGNDVPEGTTKLVRVSNDTTAQPRSLDSSGEDDEDAVDDIFYVEGYTEYTDTSTENDKKKNSSSSTDEKKSSSSSDSDDDEEDQDDNADPDAAYTDPDTGMSYYYDDSQMLYYDMYGNYYYDMYGQNPYEQPSDDGSYYDESGVYDDSGYYYGDSYY